MDNDFSEKIRELLADPSAMEKIMTVVNGMGLAPAKSEEPAAPEPVQVQQEEPESKPPETPAPQDPIASVLSTLTAGGGASAPKTGDHRVQLLGAIKPLLREEKREKVDNLQRALTVASLLNNFKKP